MLSTHLLRMFSQIWLPRWPLLVSVSTAMIPKSMIYKAMNSKATALSAQLLPMLVLPMLVSKALASPVLMPQPASIRSTAATPLASPVLVPQAWTVHIKGPTAATAPTAAKTATATDGQTQLPALAVFQKLQPALSFSTTAQAQAMLQIRYQQHIGVPAFGDDESYQLHIGKSSSGLPQIRLDAQSSTGVLYGLMTLSQLLDCPAAPPHSADSSLADQQKANSIQTDGAQTNRAKTNSAQTSNTQSPDSAVCRLPQLQIHDKPRFGWRGLLLDSARRFIPLADIRRTLDGMAAAKLNVLHWHLTDDQAWRLESRAYPKLQQVASQGQYYRQSDVRELVQYASVRGIRLVPELDVPGHAWAIGQAYPELLAWPDGQAPAPLPPQPGFGVFTAVLDPSKAEVWQFLQALIEEWRDLFPDAFLHIGGDEVKPDYWLASGRVKAYMAEHQLEDAHALQAFFNQKLAARLSKAGRRMVGWDEVLHPALPKSTVVQSWQGQDALGAAVRAGHPALLSAGFYLDMPQPAFYHWANDPLQVTAPLPTPQPQQMQQAWQFSFSLQRLNQKPVSGQLRLYRQQAGERDSQLGKLDAAQPDSQWTASIESHGRGAVPATVRWLADGQLLQLGADNYLGPLQFELPLSVNQLQQLAQSPSSQAMSAQQAASDPALPAVISAATPGASSEPVSEPAPAQQPAASLQRSGLGRVGNHQYPLTVQAVAYQPLAPLAPLTAQEQQLLWGGEAALWTELVSPQLLDTKLWPRLFVVAERFWSPATVLAELAAPAAITTQAGVTAAQASAERFNQRLAALDDYAARIGLLHRQQSQALLNQFSVNATEQQALKELSPYLQPLHYYGRHHVKTVAGRYNLHEPLDQLADALLLEPPALLQLSADFAGTAACQLPASWPAHQARLQQLSAQLANYQGPAAQELQALLAQQQRLNLALQAFAEPAADSSEDKANASATSAATASSDAASPATTTSAQQSSAPQNPAQQNPAQQSPVQHGDSANAATLLSADKAKRSELRQVLDAVQQPSGEVVLALPAPVRAWLARCEAVK